MVTRPAAESKQAQEPGDKLATLRAILLGADQRRLDELSRRVQERQARTEDVAEVLPAALLREYERSPLRLKEAVRRPIEETLRDSVRDDPRPLADAIFPVIGPAIRRYITASFRALAESLSRTIEQGLSPRRQLAWRFAAWRAGISFGQYVLQRTFVYRVEHVYLIQAGSGLLLGEAHADDSPVMDSDAVSGMLSALQSFVLDSFDVGEEQQLQTADLGDYTLWAIHGPYAMLACAIRGAPGGELRGRLEDALEGMHLQFGRHLEAFDGSQAEPAGLEAELNRCLHMREVAEVQAGRGIGWPVWLLLAAAVAAAAWWGVTARAHALAAARLTATLQSTPGIVLTGIERRGERLLVRGLRDPLAPTLQTLAAAADVGPRTVEGRLEPYQSLEPELVLRRLSRALAQPDGVELRLEEGVLYVEGTADAQWLARIGGLTLVSPAVERIDTSGLRVSDAALLARAEALLAPPAGVTLTLRGGLLQVAGTAPLAWLQDARARAPSIAGIAAVDLSAARVEELDEAARLLDEVDGASVRFVDAATGYAPGEAAHVARLGAVLVALDGLAARLGRPLAIAAVGHTDGTGPDATNAALREARAARVRSDLVAAGVPGERIVARAGPPGDAADPSLRRVVLEVSLPLDPYAFAAP